MPSYEPSSPHSFKNVPVVPASVLQNNWGLVAAYNGDVPLPVPLYPPILILIGSVNLTEGAFPGHIFVQPFATLEYKPVIDFQTGELAVPVLAHIFFMTLQSVEEPELDTFTRIGI